MKIAVLSTYDKQGGAAISAHRLHLGLRKLGHECSMLVQKKSGNDRSVYTESNPAYQLVDLFRHRLDKLPLYPASGRKSYSTGLLPNRRIVTRVKSFQPDVVHLQWINSGFISLPDVARLNLPIIWRLPDWWLMTAGCHIPPYDCKLFQTDCSHCPILHSSERIDRSAWLLKWKCAQIKKIRNLKIVTPSRALAEDAANSRALAGTDIRVIPNGLDLNIHKPLDKAFARRALNFPQEGKIVLYGAIDAHTNPNKGFAPLLQALTRVKSECRTPFTCISFGSEAGTENHDGILVQCIGVLQDPFSLNLLYSAADVMVAPSYQEPFGQTAIEALACGTPVVAFQTTGLLDIVDSGENGYLAEKFDVDDLARGISYVLEHPEPHKLAMNARAKVEREFDIRAVASRYAALYEETIAEAGRSAGR